VRALASLVALAEAGTLIGCASPPERLYTLLGPEPPAAVSSPTLHVALGPVTIPEAVDRPQLVVRQGAVRLVALEQERWAEPLREAVPRVLAESMSSHLPSISVTNLATPALTRPDMRVVVDVTRFEAIPGQRVIIEAHWWLRAADRKPVPEGISVARVKVQGGPEDYDAVVAAEAAGLAEIGAQLSRVIEKETALDGSPPK